MNDPKLLGEERIGKLLWQFSIPAIISMLANSLYTVIDRIFVGRVVGALAISGLTVTFPISLIIMAFGMLIGIGAGTLVSLRLGENEKEEAEKILGNAFSLVIIVSILLAIICLLSLDFLLRAFGASKDILPYAKQFIGIILLGTPAQYIGFGLSTIIRSEGNPRMSMIVMLSNTFLNIVLDIIFIYLLGWGVAGTAIATVISQTAAAILVLFYFTKGRGLLKLKVKNMFLKKEIILSIFAIGMAPFFMQIASSFVNILLNRELVQYGGDVAIGALGIITSVAMLLLMPVIGITQGSQPIIGYNYGAKNFQRVKKTLILTIAAATLISTIGFIIVQLLPEIIIKFFSPDPALVGIGTQGIRIFLLMLPIIGFQIVSANFFQAIGKAVTAMFLSLSRQVIILIPMLLLLPNFFHLQGVWLSAPIADFLSSLVTAFFLIREIKKLNRLTRQEKDRT